MDFGDLFKQVGVDLVKNIFDKDDKGKGGVATPRYSVLGGSALFESPRKPNLASAPPARHITSAKMDEALAEWMQILTSYRS